MSADKHGGQAFPVPPANSTSWPKQGMTLRDYFAGQALAGWLASYPTDSEHPVTTGVAVTVAECSYQLADAMLAARSKGDE